MDDIILFFPQRLKREMERRAVHCATTKIIKVVRRNGQRVQMEQPSSARPAATAATAIHDTLNTSRHVCLPSLFSLPSPLATISHPPGVLGLPRLSAPFRRLFQVIRSLSSLSYTLYYPLLSSLHSTL